MRILSMQATFGKLENQTLTFQPGLNVIHAPNEWGKSTWCAFIAAMLYGIDTRERSTQTTLADKERYAPWSGKPMAGRMELEWNGRSITIERSTKGRSIFGVFNAYETDSGVAVEELTADNCGLMLLGVEKSVFLKSAFIRHNDLVVTQDEALRRRLNALVTTGDESGDSDRLAQKLKELKNTCRHNKTGLLPQLETSRSQTVGKLDQLRSLHTQMQTLAQRKNDLAQEIRDLENHQIALRYQAAQADLAQVEKAKEAYRIAQERLDTLEAACAPLPTQAEAAAALEQLSQLQEQVHAQQQQDAPALPQPPAQKAPFHGMDAVQTQDMVNRDIGQYQALLNSKQYIPYIIVALLGLAVAIAMCFMPQLQQWNILPIIAGAIALTIMRIMQINNKKLRTELEHKYGNSPAYWQSTANAHIQALEAYAAAMAAYEDTKNRQRQESQQLQQQIMAITQGAPATGARKYWENIQQQHRLLQDAKKEADHALAQMEAVESMVRKAEPPKEPDALTYTPQETAQRLAAATAQQHQLQQALGQAQGQAESIGSEELLQKELYILDERIKKLEKTNEAIMIAQETLEEAALELQRQFAPRLTKRSSELFSQLTDGRYDRLTLDQELSLHAGATEEDTLHPWLWRSDGTVDQLYLALRLSVAEELIPDAPLILDDALIRFDDTRMEKALALLDQAANHRQVILFSCQNREKSVKNH